MGAEFWRTFLFLLQVTLDGGGYWDCASQSGYQEPSIFLIAAFLIVVIILLLNMLIAMMAETFTKVTESGYDNYALAFSKTLVYMRVRADVAVPLNLLSIPYYILKGLHNLVRLPSLAQSQSKSPESPATEHARALEKQPSFLPAAWSAGSPVAAASQATQQSSTRDPEVIRRIDDIRLLVLSEPGKKLQFERSIVRFCRIQEEGEEPLTADETRDIMRDCTFDANQELKEDLTAELMPALQSLERLMKQQARARPS